MLEAIGVTKRFPKPDSREEITAVQAASFSLKPGEFYALVGESGSGKSTLAQLLAGLIAPTEGDVLLNGESIVPRGRRRKRELCTSIQLVLQDGKSALDPRFTVYDSLAEPIRNLTALSRAAERERIHELMREIELPSELLTRRASELSGGQQKRVGIARALATEPEIIIFDEAVSGLDVIVRKSILDLLKRLHAAQNADRKSTRLNSSH